MAVGIDKESALDQMWKKLEQWKTSSLKDTRDVGEHAIIEGGIINCTGGFCCMPYHIPGPDYEAFCSYDDKSHAKYYDTITEFIKDNEPKVLPLEELTCIFTGALDG